MIDVARMSQVLETSPPICSHWQRRALVQTVELHGKSMFEHDTVRQNELLDCKSSTLTSA